MKEREINIVDLLAEILMHWRIMLVWMIAGAMLFGIFGYLYSGNRAKQCQTQAAGMLQDPRAWLTEEEIQNVAYVAGCEKIYFEKAIYLEKSPLMQIDSNKVNKAETTIAVIAANQSMSLEIEKVYEDIVESGECIVEVAEKAGMEPLGMSNMLYLDKTIRSTAVKNGEGTVILESKEEQGDAVNTFKVVAVHGDEETCREMLVSTVAYLKEKQSGIESVLGEHELVVVNESFGVISDMEIADQQKNIINDIMTMKKNFQDARAALSENEQSYYSLLRSGADGDESVVQETAPSAGTDVKYALLGAVAAAFAYAFILFLIFVFNSKIRAIDDFQELYGLPQLGMIPKESGGKKALGIVDKWILSIRDHNKRQFSPEEALELAAVAVKMVAGKKALREMCLMGCGLKERSIATCGRIREYLEKDGIRVSILNNVLYDASALVELEKAKGVVLVESAGFTLYNEITEELELLKRQGIEVLGGILVE